MTKVLIDGVEYAPVEHPGPTGLMAELQPGDEVQFASVSIWFDCVVQAIKWSDGMWWARYTNGAAPKSFVNDPACFRRKPVPEPPLSERLRVGDVVDDGDGERMEYVGSHETGMYFRRTDGSLWSSAPYFINSRYTLVSRAADRPLEQRIVVGVTRMLTPEQGVVTSVYLGELTNEWYARLNPCDAAHQLSDCTFDEGTLR